MKKVDSNFSPISDDLLDRNPVIGKGRYQKMKDLMSKRINFSIYILWITYKNFINKEYKIIYKQIYRKKLRLKIASESLEIIIG